MERDLIGFWHSPSNLYIVGAGSFASPDRGLPHAVPRLYNLLLVKKDRSILRVLTRAQPFENGAWEGWANWPAESDVGDGARFPYFDIPLR